MSDTGADRCEDCNLLLDEPAAADCTTPQVHADAEQEPAICVHCGRVVEQVEGRWIDPEATGDDSLWRETCDRNDRDRIAAHEVEPEMHDYEVTFTCVVSAADAAGAADEARRYINGGSGPVPEPVSVERQD